MNLFTINRTRHISTIYLQTWCIFFLFSYACFFKKFNPLYFWGYYCIFLAILSRFLSLFWIKTKFFQKKYRIFRFSAVFLCPKRELFAYYIQKQQTDYDHTKLLQSLVKSRRFHKKNEINIVTKQLLSKKKPPFKLKFAVLFPFSFFLSIFFLFCN